MVEARFYIIPTAKCRELDAFEKCLLCISSPTYISVEIRNVSTLRPHGFGDERNNQVLREMRSDSSH